MKYTIIESGEAQDISKRECDYLARLGLIYPCEECGKTFYHPMGDDWKEAESVLKKFRRSSKSRSRSFRDSDLEK